MSRRGRQKGTYIADPERRAYLGAVRQIREQVLREHEKELEEAGFWKRLLLDFRIEREIKKRVQAEHITPGGPHVVT
jgi:hypothetical protein